MSFYIDRGQAERFLEVLTGSAKNKVTFQTFGEGEGKGDGSLARILHGTFDEHYPTLMDLSSRGSGVFVTINETDLKGRKEENITKIRAYFVDEDHKNSVASPIRPSMMIETPKGHHKYFLTCDASPKNYKSTQERLVAHFNGDPACVDLPRVCRLPGFPHQKNPKNPIHLKIIHAHRTIYTEKEILAAFPAVTTTKSTTKLEQEDFRRIDFERLLTEAGKQFKRTKNRFDVICPNSAQHSTNSDLTSSTSILIQHDGRGVFKCQHAHCKELSLDDFLEQFSEDDVTFNSEPISPNLGLGLANKFIDLFCSSKGIAFYCGSFYEWTSESNHYRELRDATFKAKVVKFLQLYHPAKSSVRALCGEVLEHLSALCLVEDLPGLVPPFFRNTSSTTLGKVIALKSSLFNLGAYLRGSEVGSLIQSPTNDYFCVNSLPYDFESECGCPTFDKFLNETFISEDTRNFLQEYFGYALISDRKSAKILFLLGEGANGKSVLCTVLGSFLGAENCSAIGLESMNIERTFPLAQLRGKLANIVEETPDSMSVGQENILKQLCLSSRIQVEQKNRDPFTLTNTALLVFAANKMPKVNDRSDGMYRRSVILNLEKQILDESKQDKRLVDPNFWIQSGELPGILNWALQGLKRLLARGNFIEPEQSLRFKSKFRSDCNPPKRYLEQFFEHGGVDDRIPQPVLFAGLKHWSKQEGYSYSASAPAFCDEVKRWNPIATLTPNPVSLKNEMVFSHLTPQKKTRLWHGIRCKDPELFQQLFDYSEGQFKC